MKNSLLEAFNVKTSTQLPKEAKDYFAFENKELLDEIRKNILMDLSEQFISGDIISPEIINREIDEFTFQYDLTTVERNYLYHLIDGEINGYGPLTELLSDDNITEIMVNSPSNIYIEIDGVITKDESVSFINDAHIIRTIEKLISKTNKTIDINNPMIDARLEDGSRINAVIPPLSQTPIITIRKFRKNIVDMETLVGNGSLTPEMARFLCAAVESKLNILVCGGTGSGKTSILNILGNYIPEDERIITIEDVRELNLKQQNVVSLNTKSSNYDNLGEVTIRDLVKNSLRMRPDRIIIGEVRGAEAFDLLQAMNTGHEGSLTTLHANNPKDALNRLETMVLMDGIVIPLPVIRKYISNAIDLVVYITRLRDGRRKITNISEINELDENNEIKLETIFEFILDKTNENGLVQGEYKLHSKKSESYKKIKNAGYTEIDDIFK